MTKDHNIRVESQLKMGECTKVMKQIPDGSVRAFIGGKGNSIRFVC